MMSDFDDDDVEKLFSRGKVCAKSGRFVELVTRVVPVLLRSTRTVADIERCKMLCMSSVMHHKHHHRDDDDDEMVVDEKEVSARESLLKMFLLLLLQEEEKEKEKEEKTKTKKTLSRRLLEEGGYWFRLSEDVLRYAKDRVDLGRAMETTTTTRSLHSRDKSGGGGGEEEKEEEEVVHAKMFDDVFPPSMLNVMRKQFADVASPFWTQHDYFNPAKKRQFFSYVHDVTVDGGEDTRSRFLNTMDVVIEYAKRVAGRAFPRVLTEATRAEWWCHNRAHCEGHQMHFDSDDEGINGLRHPICSVVVFISANGETTTGTAKEEENEKDDERNASKRRKKNDSRRERFVGGPTLVTTQRDGDQKNTNFNEIRGYLAYPKTNRCVVFDGELLHGVVPGRGLNAFADSNIDENSALPPPPLPTRTTLMIAFWDKIEVRGSFGSIGSARAFPTFEQVKDEKAHWRHLFNIDDDGDDDDDGVNGRGIRDGNDIEKRAMRAPEMLPIPIEKVWHPLNDAAKEMMSLPNYDQCFQGF